MDKKLQPLNNLSKTPKRKKRPLKKIILGIFLGGILGFVIFLWFFFSQTSSVLKFDFWSNPLKSTDNRVNVLLLGIGGGNHEGALLTDSIIVYSYNLKTHKTTLISIPRDLWLPDLKTKVNAAYENGREEGSRLKYAEDKIDDILGIPIHYGIRLDFSGFARAIDQVGGVDVNIANTFDDYEFPITGKENDMCGYQVKDKDFNPDEAKAANISPGKHPVYIDPSGKESTDSATLNFSCRFKHIRFDKGLTPMDGETALNFVRSRKGTNGEGSDFARSKRQQLVIEAFREKVLSLQTLANPQKVASLISTFGDSVETDIPAERFLDFYNLTKKQEASESLVLGDLGDGTSLFINPPPDDYGGAWVLVPPKDDFTQVKKYLKAKLDGKPLPSPTGQVKN